jgi:hypothetical protein
MAIENWPPRNDSRRCDCPRCREARAIDRLANQSLSVALRHAQNRAESELRFEAAQPPGPLTLPGKFSGWRAATPLPTVLSPGRPHLFGVTGTPLLYRVYEEGKQIPLYIGMVTRSSIASRVASHMRGLLTRAGTLAGTPAARAISAVTAADFQRSRSEIEKLRILVAQSGRASRVKVQHGSVELPGNKPPDAKLLHAYEAALQVIERPHSYVGTVWTFEDDFEDDLAFMDG